MKTRRKVVLIFIFLILLTFGMYYTSKWVSKTTGYLIHETNNTNECVKFGTNVSCEEKSFNKSDEKVGGAFTGALKTEWEDEEE